MAYELHVERPDGAAPLTLAEWRAFVAADPEFEEDPDGAMPLYPAGDGTVVAVPSPGFARWVGHPDVGFGEPPLEGWPFRFSGGTVSTPYEDEEVTEAAARVALAVGAELRGDGDEPYDLSAYVDDGAGEADPDEVPNPYGDEPRAIWAGSTDTARAEAVPPKPAGGGRVACLAGPRGDAAAVRAGLAAVMPHAPDIIILTGPLADTPRDGRDPDARAEALAGRNAVLAAFREGAPGPGRRAVVVPHRDDLLLEDRDAAASPRERFEAAVGPGVACGAFKGSPLRVGGALLLAVCYEGLPGASCATGRYGAVLDGWGPNVAGGRRTYQWRSYSGPDKVLSALKTEDDGPGGPPPPRDRTGAYEVLLSAPGHLVPPPARRRGGWRDGLPDPPDPPSCALLDLPGGVVTFLSIAPERTGGEGE